jgi:hypothetical protein
MFMRLSPSCFASRRLFVPVYQSVAVAAIVETTPLVRRTGQRPSRKTTGENRARQRDRSGEHGYPAAAMAPFWAVVRGPVIHAVFPLAEASEAHRLMETSAHIGKIMLQVA